MLIRFELQGTSPMLHHNPRMVDPEFEINRQIKELTKKRNKTDADLHQIERLEWFGGLHDEDGRVVCPTAKVRKCIVNAARTSKRGKHVERALSFMALNVPLTYTGPKEIEKLYTPGGPFVSRLSVGIGNKRVMRVRPKFYPWAVTVDGLLVDDVGLNFDELQGIAELAGVIEGIGDNRINGYGRFTCTVIKV